MSFILIIFFVSLLSTLIYSYIKVVYGYFRKVRIVQNESIKKKSANYQTIVKEYKQAPGPIPWPILGNLHLIGQYSVPFEGFTELAKKFGDVYTLTFGSKRCLIVNNLELIREVLNQNGKYFAGRPDFLRYHVLFGGDRNNSLALCDWSQLQQKRRNLARKHCSPRDSTSFFEKMSNIGCFEMYEFIERLNELIEPGSEIQLKPIIQQTCANMFSQYMCSIRFGYEDKEFQHIVRCFDEIFWEINQGYAVDFLPWLSPFYYKHMKKIKYWSETIRAFILGRIINNREQNIVIDTPENDFTDALLKSLVEDEEVSRDTIIYMLEDFIGGHSAIGNLVMLALAYIVRNPTTGKLIQEEIDSLLGDENRTIVLTDTSNMPYTLATIYEVLRYSSSPIVPHVATEDVTISGYGVTKGTVVFINNYELNTSSKYWDQPKEFKPERFLEPMENTKTITSVNSNGQKQFKLKKNIPHFLPFSIGKRTCIGQNLVKGFAFIMLANIMKNYNVLCNDISKIKTYSACIAVPPDTFALTLICRKGLK